MIDYAANPEHILDQVIAYDRARGRFDFVKFVQHERGARDMRSFTRRIVAGLLQTQEYAESLGADALHCKIRTARQELAFARDVGFHVLMAEAAVTAPDKDPALMTRQRQHILQLVAQEKVTVQLVPDIDTTRVNPALEIGHLSVLALFGARPAEAVYLEGYIGAQDEWATFDKYFNDNRSVQAAEGAWDRLLACAYSIDQSREYIEALG